MFTCTVKLGYNDHGYNKFMAIMNKICRIIWSQMVTLLYINLHGYNDVTVITNKYCDGPIGFVITEFDFTYCFLSNPALQKTNYLFWFRKNKIAWYLILFYLPWTWSEQMHIHSIWKVKLFPKRERLNAARGEVCFCYTCYRAAQIWEPLQTSYLFTELSKEI